MSAPERSTLQLAEHWLSIERPDRALEAVSNLRGDEAIGLPAFLVRVTALHDLERHPEAVTAAQAALERHGPEPHLLALLGGSLRALGRLDEAERALLEGLAQEPGDIMLLCWYARLCLEVGQVDKAEKLLDRAASHSPEHPMVLSGRVVLSYVQGRDAQMLRDSRETLRVAPDEAAAHVLYGFASANRGDFGAADRSMSRAVADNPGDRELIEAAREVRLAKHPLLRPLWPLHRFGVMQVWLAVVATMLVLRAAGLRPLWIALGLAYFVYCVYSWVVPPIVRRVVRRGR